MLDRLALPTLPVLPGRRVILRQSIESDVDDRVRHPIDPGKEDGHGYMALGAAAASRPSFLS